MAGSFIYSISSALKKIFFTAAAFLIISASDILHSQTADDFLLSESQCREEAEIAIEKIRSTHPDPYWKVSREEFDDYSHKLLERKGLRQIGTHYFDMARLFSMISDTHTQIYPDLETPGFRDVYPVRFRMFSDGLYLIAGALSYQQFVGKKILRIGGIDAMGFMDTLARYVSADHLERKKTLAEFLLIMPETYRYFDLESNGKVSFTYEEDGAVKSGFLAQKEEKKFAQVFYEDPFSFGVLVPEGWHSVYTLMENGRPVGVEEPGTKYRMKYILTEEGKSAIYLQINKNEDQSDKDALFDFILNSFQQIRSRKEDIDRIIIDLRYNLGGWIRHTAALSRLLYGAGFAAPGKTFVLIGPETVSAGAILAADIEQFNYTSFVGEKSGSKPNMFLDHKTMDLPYSHFYAENSSYKLIITDPDDLRECLYPDFEVKTSYADFLAGRDKALELALKIQPAQVTDILQGLPVREIWKRSSQHPK